MEKAPRRPVFPAPGDLQLDQGCLMVVLTGDVLRDGLVAYYVGDRRQIVAPVSYRSAYGRRRLWSPTE